MSSSPARSARPQAVLRRARGRERFVCDRPRPMPTSRRSGSIRRARPACPRACGICIPICGDRGDLCEAGARHPRGRRRPVRGKTVLRLWPRQRADLPDVGRRHHRAECERPTPARMFALMNKYNPTIFYGVPTLFAAMLNDETLKASAAAGGLRICTSAGEALPESVGNSWKARFGVDILDGVGSTDCCTSSCPTRPATSNTAPPAARCRATRCGWSTKPARTCRRRGRRAAGRCALGRRGLLESAQQEPPDLRGPLDPHRRQIYPRRRRPLHVLRPRRRHVQGLRHLGVAVRGRERADHPSRRAGSRRRARSRSGRAAEAESLRGAARRTQDRRTA